MTKPALFTLFITFLILSSCRQTASETTVTAGENVEILKATSEPKQEKVSCMEKEEVLDTTSFLQGKELSENSLNDQYTFVSASTHENMGITVLQHNADSSYILAFTEITGNGSKTGKVIGTREFRNLKPNFTFQSMCNFVCDSTDNSTGLIEFDLNDNINTIDAWKIDPVTHKLLKLQASAVDCYDSFNADFD